jgi:hypothetical protein
MLKSLKIIHQKMESEDEFYENAQYLSQDDEEEEVEDSNKRGKQHQNHTWYHKQTFVSAAKAIAWVKNERIWSPTTAYDSAHGQKQLYRCNRVIQRGPHCACALHLLYHADSFQVSVYISQEEHTYDEIGRKAHGINPTKSI